MANLSRHFLALCAASLFVGLLGPDRASLAGGLPPELLAARDAAAAVQGKAMDRELAAWEKVETLPTAGEKGAAHWSNDAGEIIPSDEGLRLGCANGAIFARFKDKTFKGPIGIQYQAKAPAGFPASDLSCDMEASPVRIQLVFGGYGNVATHINVCTSNGVNPIKNPAAPLIKPDTWQTVVLLIYEDRTCSFVDGQPIVEAMLPEKVTPQSAFTVALYVASTEGLFRDVTILRPRVPAVPVPAAAAIDEGVMKKHIEVAAKYLGDTNYEARQAAADILWNLRPLSNATIQELAHSTDPEIHGRAAEMLERITPPKPTSTRPPIHMLPQPILPRVME